MWPPDTYWHAMFKGWEDPKKKSIFGPDYCAVDKIYSFLEYFHLFCPSFSSWYLRDLNEYDFWIQESFSADKESNHHWPSTAYISNNTANANKFTRYTGKRYCAKPMHLVFIVQFKFPEIAMWFFIGKTHTNLMDRPFNRQLTFALPYWITAVRLYVYLDFVKSIEQKL